MSDAKGSFEWGERAVVYLARFLAIVWALGWIAFGLLSGLGEGMGPERTLVHAAAPGLLFLVTAVIACRWDVIGGTLLLLEGVIITAYFVTDISRISLLGITFVILSTTVPTFFISFLFLANRRKSKTVEFTQDSM